MQKNKIMGTMGRKFLPVDLFLSRDSLQSNDLFFSFGLMRSGQHLVIDWICRGLSSIGIVHFNHCHFHRNGLRYTLLPYKGNRVIYAGNYLDDSQAQGMSKLRDSLPKELPKNIFFSVEDQSPEDPAFKRMSNSLKPTTILILRDPMNWLASSLMRGMHTPKKLDYHKSILKKYLYTSLSSDAAKSCPISINYNSFVTCEKYRKSLATHFSDFDFNNAEAALTQTPYYGGGSSFKKTNTTIFDRWKEFGEDETFMRLINDRELLRLSKDYFGEIPPIRSMERFIS